MEITDFESIVLRVGNARTASNYFVTKYGFEPVAESCLETGNRDDADIVIKLNDIQMIFKSDVSQDPTDSDSFAKHREHVMDVSLKVADLHKAYYLHDDEISVKIPIAGSITHTLIDSSSGKIDYTNKTGWRPLKANPINKHLPSTGLLFIDHVVSNYPEGEMEKQCEWYEKNFGMHRFWSVDETQVHTEYSALRSVVMTSPNERVKLPINEPAPSSLKRGKSQIQEYLDYNMGPGVQHIALRTDNIIESVRALRARGLTFYVPPSGYYTDLKERLGKSKCVIKEDLRILEELQILVDFDDNGYLLQIFTESFDYRPTLFFEIIQRNNHDGFGVGSFKALFECIEAEQAKRGNL